MLLLLLFASGCQFKLSSDSVDNNSPLLHIERFDRLEYLYLTIGDFSAFQRMNTEYPIETRTLIEDVIRIGDATDSDINSKFLKFYQDTTLQSLISSVESEFANVSDLNAQFNTAFTNLKSAIPDIAIPRIYSQISALNQSVVVGNGTIGISLDKYLGVNYPLYKRYYPLFQRKYMTRNYIVSDCLSFYLMSLYPLPNFEKRPQVERDLHVGKIQWVVNQVLKSKVYRNRYVRSVERYMTQGHHSYEELLKLSDFSKFKLFDCAN